MARETGSATLASEIGGQWVFWQTGTVGLDKKVIFDTRGILNLLVSGAVVILIGGVLIAWFGRRRAV